MFTRNFSSSCFLRNVFGTQPFLDYCQRRGIALEQTASGVMQREDLLRWVEALARLPADKQAEVELELAEVNDMADHVSVAQLLQGAHGSEMPPDSIPGDTAIALWFFLRHPGVFHEAFLHQEVAKADDWWNARGAAGVALADLPAAAAALALGLREAFRLREGSGRFCAVDARKLNGAFCFVAQVSDRLRFLDVFTEGGEYATQSVRPALPVVFVYYPADGTVLLQTRLRSRDRLLELFRLFGRAVLGAEVGGACAESAFDLERLKGRFDPLPDGPDMTGVRVKSLHFRYPERQGRRQVKLETLAGDGQFAILEMIEAHLSGEEALGRVQVSHVELQIDLEINGGARSHAIRLWPNRSNLGGSPLHERFRACLKAWGLATDHAGQP